MKIKSLTITEAGIVGALAAPAGTLLLAADLAFFFCRTPSAPKQPYMLLGMAGLMLLLTGVCLLLLEVRHRRITDTCIRSGKRVMATITGIKKYPCCGIHCDYPYAVTCAWTDPANQKTHVFTSRPLKSDPSGVLTSGEVPVYLDPDHGKRACVDLSAVLPDEE